MVQSITTNAAQQHAIRTHLSSPCICPEPLFIHGPASTGKTCDMKAILSSLPDHCLSVYIDCVEFCTARSIYGAIVSKLGKELHSMTASKSKKRALESSSFFSSSRAVVTNQAQFATHVGELLKEYRDMKVWIVLDNVDRVCSRAGASSGTDAQVLSVLDHLGEALSVDVGLVMISQVAWSSGMFAASTSRVGKGTRDPTVIEYTAYSPADLERICLTSDSFKCKVGVRFVSSIVLSPCSRGCRQQPSRYQTSHVAHHCTPLALNHHARARTTTSRTFSSLSNQWSRYYLGRRTI